MYILTDRSNGYSILDTSDGVIDALTKEELIPFLNQGNLIVGLTPFSIEYDAKIDVILRLYKEDEVKDFDGYLLRDVGSDYSEYLTQIIDINDVRADLSSEEFLVLVDNIRYLNKGMYDESRLNNVNVGYTVQYADVNSIGLKDLTSGRTYDCDFFTCLYIYLEENKSIDGLESIDIFNIVCLGTVLSRSSTLLEYYNFYGESTKRVSYNKTLVDSLKSNWGSLDRDFNSQSCFFLADSYLPIFNVKNCIQQVDYNCSVAPFFVKYDIAYLFNAGNLYFRNGNILSDKQDLVNLYKLFKYETSDLESEVEIYLTTRAAKAKALGRVFKPTVKSWIHYEPGFFFNNTATAGPRLNANLYNIVTKFGGIQIDNNWFGESDITDQIQIWLTRVAHAGSAWYSLTENELKLGTQAVFNTESIRSIADTSYIDLVDTAILQGITYYNDMIIPLRLSQVYYEGTDNLCIMISCILSKKSDAVETTGLLVVDIPLVHFGGKLVEYNDCYMLCCLLNTVYIEKSVMEHTQGKMSFSTITSGRSAAITRKAENETWDALIKYIKRNFKVVFESI